MAEYKMPTKGDEVRGAWAGRPFRGRIIEVERVPLPGEALIALTVRLDRAMNFQGRPAWTIRVTVGQRDGVDPHAGEGATFVQLC